MAREIFHNAHFVKSAVLPKDYPNLRDLQGRPLSEIAIAGRSNVGKSSLLNDLFRTKGLVKTSSVPGKTQTLNFFAAGDHFAFVDLPGYGYAKVPQELRKQWGPMVQTYLHERKTLKVILLLIDSRRIPQDDDKQLLEWIAHYQKAVILVITKIDQLSRNERVANTQKILKAFNAENLHYVHYSATHSEGRRELTHLMLDALKDEETV